MERLQTQLAALAAGLCQDAGVGLEVHEGGWAFDTIRRVILVSAKALREDGPEICAGILAHEVAHYYISRYTRFATEQIGLPSVHLLLNGLEDPRVNRWMPRRYPGAGVWLRAALDKELDDWAQAARGPEFLQFCLECAGEEIRHWEAAPPSRGLSPRLIDALAQTREARKHYALGFMPEPDLNPECLGSELAEDWIFEVLPALRPTASVWLPAADEQGVEVLAVRAFYLALDEILPVAHQLYTHDVERLTRTLSSNAKAYEVARESLSKGHFQGVRTLVDAALNQAPDRAPPASRDHRRAAERLLEVYIEGSIRPPLIRGRLRRGGKRGKKPGELMDLDGLPPLELPRRPEDAYEQARRKVASQIERLCQDLETALRPRKRLGLRGGYPSGFRMDMRRLMVYEADPRRYNELWVRKSIPDRRDAAITLLVDLSGSMRGPKSEAALLGTVLIAETLHRIGVPFALHGFQDVLIPFARFGQGLTTDARRAIGEIPQEIAGCRYGGNNEPGYNDDGPCVQAAAEDLLQTPAQDRLLIVVSDGLPEGRHSTADDLRRIIRRLMEPDVSLSLIGVGLGPETGHVTDFYPRSVANVPVDRFASAMGQLIRRALLGSEEAGGRTSRR